jgi:hypothetical protein
VTVSADEIAKARAIVREIAGPLGLATIRPGDGPPLLEASNPSEPGQ